MLLDSRTLWYAQTNTYAVGAAKAGPVVLVDAPPDVPGLAEMVRALGVTPVALLVTHGHVDHAGGAGGVAGRFGLATYAHPDDDFLSLDPESQLRSLFGVVPEGDYGFPVAEQLFDGQVLELAGLRFEVRHTPGHTPGHCCFYVESEGVLFTGDQLFAGSIGRTDLPGGSYEQLMTSMRDKVLTLDDEISVLPGHGPATTLARERRSNPFLQGI